LASLVCDSGGEVRLGTPARAVEVAGNRVTIGVEGGDERFEEIVSAVPPPILLPMLEGAPPRLVEWLGLVRYRPTLSLALLLDRPAGSRFFGLSFPRGVTRYVAAVAVLENKGIPLGPTQHGVLIAFPTPVTAPELVHLEAKAVLDLMLPEIAVAFPEIERRVRRARVYRWPVGSPQFYPGYLGHLQTFRTGAITGGSRLAVAGDFLYGPSVEGAVVSGFAAAAGLA
jgi:protoporphyrinogen/coproporphyrinogen III oxidase